MRVAEVAKVVAIAQECRRRGHGNHYDAVMAAGASGRHRPAELEAMAVKLEADGHHDLAERMRAIKPREEHR